MFGTYMQAGVARLNETGGAARSCIRRRIGILIALRVPRAQPLPSTNAISQPKFTGRRGIYVSLYINCREDDP